MKTQEELRRDFPLLQRRVYGRQLVYLDNAATTQLPSRVMDAMCGHMRKSNANVHRGAYCLSEESTRLLEQAREKVCGYLGAHGAGEIVFTGGTTDSVNMVARGLEPGLTEGDEIVVSSLEHHSNFVPWQQLAARRGCAFRVVPCPDGEFDMRAFEAVLGENTKVVAVASVSNLTGSVLPIAEITRKAHEKGAVVVVDGAQAVRHRPGDIRESGCDFYCFSAHKMCGCSGIGVLYGKRARMETLLPTAFGGGMVKTVTPHNTTMEELPYRLEAGTPNFIGASALGAAVDYLKETGADEIARIERALTAQLWERLGAVDGVRILGSPEKREGIVSFVVKGVHSYDIAALLDKQGVAVRSGTHCAQVALRELGAQHAVRASVAFYNTEEEIDILCRALEKSIRMLKSYGGGL